MYIFCGEFSPENATENSFNSVMSFSSKRWAPSPLVEPDFSLLSKLLVKSQCTIHFQIGQFYKHITGQQALKMIICLFLSSLFLKKQVLPATGFYKMWWFPKIVVPQYGWFIMETPINIG